MWHGFASEPSEQIVRKRLIVFNKLIDNTQPENHKFYPLLFVSRGYRKNKYIVDISNVLTFRLAGPLCVTGQCES